MDLRRWPQWSQYLSKIGWIIEEASGRKVFIRKIPYLGCSIIKIQHQQNPLPLQYIDQIAKKYRALFTVIEPDYKNFEPADFKNHGYSLSTILLAHTATSIVNLEKASGLLFSSLSENARRNIKKAQKYGMRSQVVFLKDDLDNQHFTQFMKLLKNLSQIKRFIIQSDQEYYKKMQAFKDSSAVLFAYDKAHPEPIAAVWLGFYQNTAAYMQTGITQKGYQLLANYLLVWEAFKLSQKLKLKSFDFEGLYDPRFPKDHPKWIKFSEFKNRFHGKIIQYPQPYLKSYSLVFKIFFIIVSKIEKYL